MISVYGPSETAFANNGLKILQPRKAVVRKEDNGDYYCDLVDTVENINYYVEGNLVRVPTPWGPQAFRMNAPTIQMNKVTVRAWHVYFDAANYLIDDSYVVDKDANDALDHLNSATDVTSPFSVLSDIAAVDSYRCIRTTLEGAIATVVERWGGHLVRDNYNIELRANIGQNRGVTIEYAKNLQESKRTEDWSKVATKILPVGKDGLKVPETYLTYEPADYEIPYSKIVKFDQQNIDQQDFKNEDNTDDVAAYQAALLADLYTKANAYLTDNHVPRVNYSIKAYLKDISDVGDTIFVKHPKINIELTTNVIALDYDAIAERFVRVEFGNFRSGLNDLVENTAAAATTEARQMVETSQIRLQNELQSATDSIKGTMSNSYVIYDGDKILIVDTLPKEDATNVIMINNGGIGFSNSGINGTFSSAWTIGNELNMENINVINLVADMIKGGTLKLGGSTNTRGILEVYGADNSLAATLDNDSLTIMLTTGESVKLNPTVGLAGYDANGLKIYWADGREFHQRKSVVEEEITIAGRLRIIPIDTGSNSGVGFVTLVG
jgi:phage minor structural protein